MKRTMATAVSVLGFLLLSAFNCHAESAFSSLAGDYDFVGSRSCAYANAYQDFGDNFSLPYSGGTTRTGHYQGRLSLKRDGTGTWESMFTQYYHQSVNPGQIPLASYNETCDVTYEQLPNRLRLNLSNCFSTTTIGYAKGTQWIVEDRSMTFGISPNGDVLWLSNVRPAIERTWQPSAPSLVIERVCSRTMMAVRQPPPEDEQ